MDVVGGSRPVTLAGVQKSLRVKGPGVFSPCCGTQSVINRPRSADSAGATRLAAQTVLWARYVGPSTRQLKLLEALGRRLVVVELSISPKQ